jgi:hypothetical protein
MYRELRRNEFIMEGDEWTTNCETMWLSCITSIGYTVDGYADSRRLNNGWRVRRLGSKITPKGNIL